MKICYVSHTGSHFTAPYVDWFAGQGHDVHVVSLCHGDLPNAVNHHPWRGAFDTYNANWQYFWAIPRVRRIVRSIAPDVVHAHYVPSNGMMAAAAGVHPLVISARGSDIHNSVQHPIKRRAVLYALKRADLINPVSRELERKILGLGFPPDRIFRRSHGIQTKRFLLPRPVHAGPVRIICTRWLLPIYQCEMIVKAAAILAKRGVAFDLLLAGSGSLEESLRQQVDGLGLGSCLRFRGGYKPAELPGLLAESDIYVSASRSDGTSLSLLEAFAAGCFPVVSDIPANREWLSGHGDGLLFDIDDPAGLADCLQRAIEDADLRASAMETNRQRVLAEGDRQANMQALADWYERLVSIRGRKGRPCSAF